MFVLRSILPHVCLYVFSVVYLLLGSHIFILIERPYQNSQRETQLRQIHEYEAKFNDFLWQKLTGNITPVPEAYNNVSTTQANLQQLYSNNPEMEIAARRADYSFSGAEQFNQFVTEMYRIFEQRLLESHHLDESNGYEATFPHTFDRINDFGKVVFFMLSTTSTIGYGAIVPFSKTGRVFCLCYGAIGFPLILITVADLAKFVSTFFTNAYTAYLMCKTRVKTWAEGSCCPKRLPSVDITAIQDLEDEHSVAEYLWENIDDIEYVQLPSLAIFALIVGYCGLGAIMFHITESWTPLEAMYFSVISVYKIGFGDLIPQNPAYLGLSIAYVFIGMILATSCIDVVGITYLLRLHYLGRKMGEADYLAMMKRRKFRKKRGEAMREMFGLLSFLKNMKFPPQEEMPWTPDPPKTLQCMMVTAHSILLRWEPPEYNDGSVTYNLTCKAQRPWKTGPLRSKTYRRWRSTSHYSREPIEYTSLNQTEFLIKHLQSFTIYEISLVAENKWGQSTKSRLVQLTEPETAPQNLRTEVENDQGVRILWDTPIKKKNDVKNYIIYYTEKLDDPYEKWKKRCTDTNTRSQSFQSLEENTTYAFSIAAKYNSGHSPISRSLYVTVGEGKDKFKDITRSSATDDINSNITTEDSEILLLSDIPTSANVHL